MSSLRPKKPFALFRFLETCSKGKLGETTAQSPPLPFHPVPRLCCLACLWAPNQIAICSPRLLYLAPSAMANITTKATPTLKRIFSVPPMKCLSNPKLTSNRLFPLSTEAPPRYNLSHKALSKPPWGEYPRNPPPPKRVGSTPEACGGPWQAGEMAFGPTTGWRIMGFFERVNDPLMISMAWCGLSRWLTWVTNIHRIGAGRRG